MNIVNFEMNISSAMATLIFQADLYVYTVHTGKSLYLYRQPDPASDEKQPLYFLALYELFQDTTLRHGKGIAESAVITARWNSPNYHSLSF